MSYGSKPIVNLVLIGEQGSGKSTLLARLLTAHGEPAHKKTATPTVDCYYVNFKTARFDVTAFDAPGNVEYMKNATTAMACADCALVVVSAAPGEFEAGIGPDGMTRAHVLLAYTLGVKQCIVVVNKLDTIEPASAEARFSEISRELMAYVKKVGLNPTAVACLPVSALSGENVATPASSQSWFAGWAVERTEGDVSGTTLVEAIDVMLRPERADKKPLRRSLLDVYNRDGGGAIVVGLVNAGAVRSGMTLQLAPAGKPVVVDSVQFHGKDLGSADVTAGACVGLALSGVEPGELHRGDVLGDPANHPPVRADAFSAEVIMVNHPAEVHAGYEPFLDAHSAHFTAKMAILAETIDRRAGKVIEKNPLCIQNGDTAIVWFVPRAPVVVEAFSEFQPLGRFSIRDNHGVVGVGVIKEVGSLPNG